MRAVDELLCKYIYPSPLITCATRGEARNPTTNARFPCVNGAAVDEYTVTQASRREARSELSIIVSGFLANGGVHFVEHLVAAAFEHFGFVLIHELLHRFIGIHAWITDCVENTAVI